MSKTYTPGPEADAIIARQIAKGNFSSPEDVVRTGVQILEEHEAELAELRKLIDEGDTAYARGEYAVYTSGEQFLADIKHLGAERSRLKP